MKKLYIIPVMFCLGVFLLSHAPVKPKPASKKLVEDNLVGYHDNGVAQINANFKKNKLYGNWNSWYKSGTLCDSGKFVGNVPDGEWKSWYPNGKTRVIWHFSSRKLSAVKDEILRQPKMKVYAISQKPISEAIQFYRVSYWYGDEGAANKGVRFRSDMVNAPALSRDELMDRVADNTVHATDVYRPPFQEALLHGNYSSYYPDGKPREDGVFLNGMREGAWEEFSIDGSRQRGNYKHNVREGEWRQYDSNGKLLKFVRYNAIGEVMEEHRFGKPDNQ